MSAAGPAAGKMTVQVRLFADLRRFLPRGQDGPLSYHLRSGSTVRDVLSTIGIADDEEITAGLNGELAQRETPLHDGDELVLFSPMEGGAVGRMGR
jgi:molybdopterin converting factor small subunit